MIKELLDNEKSLVLVVDDSNLGRYMFRDFLEKEDYQVIEATNGIEALSLFEKYKPDIILMNFIMPGIDGVTTCAKLKELSSGERTPVIMVTSLEDEVSVNLAFEAGATDFINKPINWAILRQRINLLVHARHTEINLNQSQAFANSIIYNAIEGIIVIDCTGVMRYINPAAEYFFGYTYNEMFNKNINTLIPKLHYEDYKNIDIDINRETIAHGKNNSLLPVEFTLSKFYVGKKPFFTIVLRDITKRKKYEEIIKHQAFYDSLTDLPNRHLLKDRISMEISKAKYTGEKLAILFIDLDKFKFINDTLGHHVGDKLLKEVANRFKNCTNSCYTVARLGGDEFVILVPNITHEEDAVKISTKILEAIRTPLIIDNQELYLTISIGISIYPNHGEDSESLLINADVAMYRAKENGKNTFELYTPGLNTKAREQMELEANLRRAVKNKEFVVYYQPKVHGKTEKIIGMEALIRWNHPKSGLIPPLKFIPLAEETGLIVPIGELVLRTACAYTKKLQDMGLPPLPVAVNLSARQFELQDIAKMVFITLDETGLEPEYLELEITESIAMQHVEHTLDIIRRLREKGVKFSIDDFGTGYSSLSQLNSFSINKLKIDKSFVSNIDGQKNNSVIASTVLALGKSLNISVVAEGVETIEQANFFKENACDEMQGYYFGKPMPQDKFYEFYCEKLLEY